MESVKYWTTLNVALADDKVPEIGSDNTPVYGWECKYCPYLNLHCKGA